MWLKRMNKLSQLQLLMLLLLACQLSLGVEASSCAAARKCCDGKDPDCAVDTPRQAGKQKSGSHLESCDISMN